MPKASPIQYGFVGGQLGPRLQGRSDLARYSMGCNVLSNFLPTYQGPAVKRSGFRFVNELKNANEMARLIPFEFSREQAYILELGEGYMRVYKDSGIVESAPSVPYEITDGVGGNSLPWLEAELAAVAFVQSADVIYLVHENHPPHKISRTSDTSWTSAEIMFDWPPFRDENTNDDVVMTISAESGTSQQIQVRGKDGTGVAITGTTNATPVVVTTGASHGYTTGDVVYIDGVATATSLNNEHYAVTVLTPTTFELDGTTAPGSAGTGGTSEKIDTSFQFTSDMVGGYFKFREIIQANQSEWGAGRFYQNDDPRFGAALVAGDCIYYESNVYEHGAGVVSQSGVYPPVHTRIEDGEVLDRSVPWVWYGRGAGYAEITAVNADGYSATVDIEFHMPYSVTDSNPSETARLAGDFVGKPTPRWSEGAWNEENGYPRAVSFYEDRLWFGGTKKDPQTFWGSRTGDYENFEVVADEDDSALVFTLASDRINAIEWMAGEDVLLMGTKGGEFTADAGSAEQSITPSNIRVRRRSFYGSAENVSPITVDSATLFVQRSGTRLHELVYTIDAGGYSRLTAPDLTQMSYDILESGVVEMAYQAAPLRLLWVALSDGSLASLTYIREEEVIAWAKHTPGGTDAKIESVAVIPHPDGDQDQLWVITSRTVNGGTVRHVEFLEKPFEEDPGTVDIEDAFFLDSGLSYSGASTTTLTGLDHLEGESVTVLGNGVVMGPFTVSSGAVTLSTAVTKAQAGLAMPEAQLQTMRLESGAADGTAMGRKKRIHQIVIRLLETGEGVKYGADFDTMDEWDIREDGDPMDSPVPLKSGDTPSLTMPGGWEREGRVAVAHTVPLPCTIVSLMPQLTTESR